MSTWFMYMLIAALVVQIVKNLPTMWESCVQSLGWERKGWRKEWLPSPVFLPGEFHGQRSMVIYSPWGHKELDMIESHTHTHTHTHTHSCTQSYNLSDVMADGQKSLACCSPWGHKEFDTTKQLNWTAVLKYKKL